MNNIYFHISLPILSCQDSSYLLTHSSTKKYTFFLLKFVAQILNVVPNIDPNPSSRVVTRARIGFRARVTYFELGCPETMVIEYDKSISSSVAQKQILI